MKLCVALDHKDREKNLELCKELKDFDIWLKVGFRSFIRDGRDFLKEIKDINPNFKIFLDLKLYDIPNTMADAAEEIAKMEADMFNVHASAGEKAMRAVMERLRSFENPPIVLAVTALTSFDNESFKKIYGEDIDKKAIEFAKSAYESGLSGVVCSVFESLKIKENTSYDFLTLTPGIRPFGEDSADQKRVGDLKSAKREKSDFIVVGRPIYKAKDPKEVVWRILQEI
ncbi:MAG: orotidine-5'-phosphate decarboxylase [Epsilonproteobacteria bacterium]|nr:orotidine-5'-phosphate decarboxylase [Campylobacterota bacterium]